MSAQQTPEQAPMFDPRSCDALDLIEHLGDEVPPESRWPKTLADLFRVLEAYNRRAGMSDERAALDARDRVVLIGEYFGGRMVYIPKGDALRTAALHAQIWSEFTGRNHEDLAQRYGINVVSIYDILKQQRKLFQRRIQGRLFE
jgi:Mor family transcriptional regulator